MIYSLLRNKARLAVFSMDLWSYTDEEEEEELEAEICEMSEIY